MIYLAMYEICLHYRDIDDGGNLGSAFSCRVHAANVVDAPLAVSLKEYEKMNA